MSATVNSSIANPDSKDASKEALGQGQPARSAVHKNYKGFVAGVFSGIAKLSGESSLLTYLLIWACADIVLVGHPYVSMIESEELSKRNLH